MARNPVQVGLGVTLDPTSLNASVKEIRQALGRITGNASEFQKSLDASTARVFAFGATTLVINGVNQAFKALVGTTVEVEKRLIEIQSIFGGTASGFAGFRDSIFEVARSTGQAFGTVADAAAEFARQGLSAEDTAKRLEAALILTRVSGLDSVKSVQALTAAINGFESAGLSASQITNKLVAVDTKFAVSAKDLAEGFSRAGSTAEDAGVKFDELLGIITAVQQTTSRGGAVIGNALKSIFTRLSRSKTIEELQALGVAIDASQSGIQKLQALSNALESISDPTQASAIKELAGGVYQINIVSAALKDLSNQSSIFGQATATATNASNEAFQKNAELSKSITSQLNALIVGFTNLAEKIGQLTFAPLLKTLVEIADKAGSFFNDVLDPEKGNDFIKGIFKSIGSFLTGPGLVLISTAFVKIIQLVAGYAKEGFKSVLSIGSETERLKNIQSGIIDLLHVDLKLKSQIDDETLSIQQKEKAIEEAMKRQNALLIEKKSLLNNYAAALVKTGVRKFTEGGGFTNGKNQPILAKGYAPSFAQTIAERSAASDHGYKAGKVFNTRLHDGTGGSFQATVNSAEKIKTVRGPNGKLGTYVVPPNGFAAKGFIPNYAGFNEFRFQDALKQLKKRSPKELQAKLNAPRATEEEKRAAAQILAEKEASVAKKEASKIPLKGKNYGMLVPILGLNRTEPAEGTIKDKGTYSLDILNLRGPDLSKVDSIADPQDEQLKKNIRDNIVKETTRFANTLGGARLDRAQLMKQFSKTSGAIGAINGVVGASMEAATMAAYPISRYEEVSAKEFNKIGGDFDLRNAGPKVQSLFNLPKGVNTVDFKASTSKGNVNDFAKKILKEQNVPSAEKAKVTNFLEKQKQREKFAASGFVPNFAFRTQSTGKKTTDLVKERSDLLGQGYYGSFYKLKKDIGVKRFGEGRGGKRALPDNSDIIEEYVWSKFLSEFKNIPAVTAPKVIGNLSRSIQAKRIGKQVVADPNASSSQFGGKLSRILPELFQANGIGLDDLHTDNFTINSAADKTFEANKNFQSQYDPTLYETKSALGEAQSRGGRINILDAGAGFVTALSPDIQSELDNIFKLEKKSIKPSVRVPNTKGVFGPKQSSFAIKDSLGSEKMRGSFSSRRMSYANGFAPNFASFSDLMQQVGQKSSYQRRRIEENPSISKRVEQLNKKFPDIEYLGSGAESHAFKSPVGDVYKVPTSSVRMSSTLREKTLVAGSFPFEEANKQLISNNSNLRFPAAGKLSRSVITSQKFAGPILDEVIDGTQKREDVMSLIYNEYQRAKTANSAKPNLLNAFGLDTGSTKNFTFFNPISQAQKAQINVPQMSPQGIFSSNTFGLIDPVVFWDAARIAKETKAQSLTSGKKNVKGSGFIPNFGLRDIVESTKFAGKAAKTFGSQLPKGTAVSALTGQLDVEKIWPQLEAFIQQPEKLIKNMADLERAKQTIRTFLSNDWLRDKFARAVAPRINTNFYDNKTALNNAPRVDKGVDVGDENFLKYKLLGGTKSMKDSGFQTTDITQKGAFAKLQLGSLRATELGEIALEAEEQDRSLQSGIKPKFSQDPYSSRMTDKKGGFYGYHPLLGGVTGRIKQFRGKKYASYNDRWDVDNHPREKQMLYRHLSGEEISPEEMSEFLGTTNSYEAKSFAPYILRELVSAIPRAEPAVFKGVVPLASGFLPNFADPSKLMKGRNADQMHWIREASKKLNLPLNTETFTQLAKLYEEKISVNRVNKSGRASTQGMLNLFGGGFVPNFAQDYKPRKGDIFHHGSLNDFPIQDIGEKEKLTYVTRDLEKALEYAAPRTQGNAFGAPLTKAGFVYSYKVNDQAKIFDARKAENFQGLGLSKNFDPNFGYTEIVQQPDVFSKILSKSPAGILQKQANTDFDGNPLSRSVKRTSLDRIGSKKINGEKVPKFEKQKFRRKIPLETGFSGSSILGIYPEFLDPFKKSTWQELGGVEEGGKSGRGNFYKNFKKTASSGFIPNFSAVQDAISREKKAGVPASAIYVDQNPQLKSTRNPSGLMVANRIDEPRGGIQGIQRAKKEGKNPKSYGAAKGFVPNYAQFITGRNRSQPPQLENFTQNTEKVQKFQQSLDFLFKAFDEGTIQLRTFTKEAQNIAKAVGLKGKSAADFNKSAQDQSFLASRPPEFSVPMSYASLRSQAGFDVEQRKKTPVSQLSNKQEPIKGGIPELTNIGGFDARVNLPSINKDFKRLNVALQEFAAKMKSGEMSMGQAYSDFSELASSLKLNKETTDKITKEGGKLIGAYGQNVIARKQQASSLMGQGKTSSISTGSTLEKAGTGLEGFSNKLISAQGSLFALSLASNTLVGENEELNGAIQKVIVALSVLQLTAGLGGGALKKLGEIGKTKLGGKIGKALASTPKIFGKSVQFGGKEAAKYSIGSGAKALVGGISKKAIAARAALSAGGRIGGGVLAAGTAAAPLATAVGVGVGAFKAGRFLKRKIAKSDSNYANYFKNDVDLIEEQGASELKIAQKKASIRQPLRAATRGFAKITDEKAQKVEFESFLKQLESSGEGDKAKNISALFEKTKKAYEPDESGNINWEGVKSAVKGLEAAVKDGREALGQGTSSLALENRRRLDLVTAFSSSSKKLTEAIEKAASSFQVRETALNIGAGVNIDPSAPNASLIKDSIALAQGETTTKRSANDLKGLFATPEFSNILSKADNQDVLKNFAQQAGLEQKLLKSYVTGGEGGLKDRLNTVMDTSSPEGIEFFNKVKEAAESFKQNLTQTYQAAKNSLAETQKEQIQLAKDLVKLAQQKADIEKKAFDNLPARLNELANVGKVDPVALAKGYQEVAKEKDPLKAAEKFRGLQEQEDKFVSLRGEGARDRLREASGLTQERSRKLEAAQSEAGVDKQALKDFFKGQFLVKSERDAVNSGAVSGEGFEKLLKRLETIAAGAGPRRKEAEVLSNAFKASKEGTANKDLSAQNELDKQLKEGATRQASLNNSVALLDAQMKTFASQFGESGIISAVNILDASIRKASTNIDAFGSMASNLGIISQGMNDVLNDIKADIATLKNK